MEFDDTLIKKISFEEIAQKNSVSDYKYIVNKNGKFLRYYRLQKKIKGYIYGSTNIKKYVYYRQIYIKIVKDKLYYFFAIDDQCDDTIASDNDIYTYCYIYCFYKNIFLNNNSSSDYTNIMKYALEAFKHIISIESAINISCAIDAIHNAMEDIKKINYNFNLNNNGIYYIYETAYNSFIDSNNSVIISDTDKLPFDINNSHKSINIVNLNSKRDNLINNNLIKKAINDYILADIDQRIKKNIFISYDADEKNNKVFYTITKICLDIIKIVKLILDKIDTLDSEILYGSRYDYIINYINNINNIKYNNNNNIDILKIIKDIVISVIDKKNFDININKYYINVIFNRFINNILTIIKNYTVTANLVGNAANIASNAAIESIVSNASNNSYNEKNAIERAYYDAINAGRRYINSPDPNDYYESIRRAAVFKNIPIPRTFTPATAQTDPLALTTGKLSISVSAINAFYYATGFSRNGSYPGVPSIKSSDRAPDISYSKQRIIDVINMIEVPVPIVPVPIPSTLSHTGYIEITNIVHRIKSTVIDINQIILSISNDVQIFKSIILKNATNIGVDGVIYGFIENHIIDLTIYSAIWSNYAEFTDDIDIITKNIFNVVYIVSNASIVNHDTFKDDIRAYIATYKPKYNNINNTRVLQINQMIELLYPNLTNVDSLNSCKAAAAAMSVFIASITKPKDTQYGIINECTVLGTISSSTMAVKFMVGSNKYTDIPKPLIKTINKVRYVAAYVRNLAAIKMATEVATLTDINTIIENATYATNIAYTNSNDLIENLHKYNISNDEISSIILNIIQVIKSRVIPPVTINDAINSVFLINNVANVLNRTILDVNELIRVTIRDSILVATAIVLLIPPIRDISLYCAIAAAVFITVTLDNNGLINADSLDAIRIVAISPINCFNDITLITNDTNNNYNDNRNNANVAINTEIDNVIGGGGGRAGAGAGIPIGDLYNNIRSHAIATYTDSTNFVNNPPIFSLVSNYIDRINNITLAAVRNAFDPVQVAAAVAAAAAAVAAGGTPEDRNNAATQYVCDYVENQLNLININNITYTNANDATILSMITYTYAYISFMYAKNVLDIVKDARSETVANAARRRVASTGILFHRLLAYARGWAHHFHLAPAPARVAHVAPVAPAIRPLDAGIVNLIVQTHNYINECNNAAIAALNSARNADVTANTPVNVPNINPDRANIIRNANNVVIAATSAAADAAAALVAAAPADPAGAPADITIDQAQAIYDNTKNVLNSSKIALDKAIFASVNANIYYLLSIFTPAIISYIIQFVIKITTSPDPVYFNPVQAPQSPAINDVVISAIDTFKTAFHNAITDGTVPINAASIAFDTTFDTAVAITIDANPQLVNIISTITKLTSDVFNSYKNNRELISERNLLSMTNSVIESKKILKKSEENKNIYTILKKMTKAYFSTASIYRDIIIYADNIIKPIDDYIKKLSKNRTWPDFFLKITGFNTKIKNILNKKSNKIIIIFNKYIILLYDIISKSKHDEKKKIDIFKYYVTLSINLFVTNINDAKTFMYDILVSINNARPVPRSVSANTASSINKTNTLFLKKNNIMIFDIDDSVINASNIRKKIKNITFNKNVPKFKLSSTDGSNINSDLFDGTKLSFYKHVIKKEEIRDTTIINKFLKFSPGQKVANKSDPSKKFIVKNYEPHIPFYRSSPKLELLNSDGKLVGKNNSSKYTLVNNKPKNNKTIGINSIVQTKSKPPVYYKIKEVKKLLFGTIYKGVKYDLKTKTTNTKIYDLYKDQIKIANLK